MITHTHTQTHTHAHTHTHSHTHTYTHTYTHTQTHMQELAIELLTTVRKTESSLKRKKRQGPGRLKVGLRMSACV